MQVTRQNLVGQRDAEAYSATHRRHVEPLKAPMFFLWEKLGYGSPTELSARGINGYWMASFNTSPPDFLSECIQQLRTFEIPINEYDGGIDLQKSLINFYSDLQEMCEM